MYIYIYIYIYICGGFVGAGRAKLPGLNATLAMIRHSTATLMCRDSTRPHPSTSDAVLRSLLARKTALLYNSMIEDALLDAQTSLASGPA